jgi:hypothetical protein
MKASIRPYLCAGYFGETSIGHSFVGGGDYPEVDKEINCLAPIYIEMENTVLRKFILVKVGILI